MRPAFTAWRMRCNSDDADWESTIAINLTGAFRLARAAGRVMVAQKSGRIVTLASVSSAVSNARYAPMPAARPASRISRAFWRSNGRAGVTVNAIGPAIIRRRWPTHFDDSAARSGAGAHSDGPFGTPNDLLGAAIFLLSPAADFFPVSSLCRRRSNHLIDTASFNRKVAARTCSCISLRLRAQA